MQIHDTVQLYQVSRARPTLTYHQWHNFWQNQNHLTEDSSYYGANVVRQPAQNSSINASEYNPQRHTNASVNNQSSNKYVNLLAIFVVFALDFSCQNCKQNHN